MRMHGRGDINQNPEGTNKEEDGWRIQMKPAHKPRGAEDPGETECEPSATVCALRTPSFLIGMMTAATAAPSERPEDKRSTGRQPSGIREPFVTCRHRGDTEKELHRLQRRKFVKPKVTCEQRDLQPGGTEGGSVSVANVHLLKSHIQLWGV